jgi:hypothetical protein
MTSVVGLRAFAGSAVSPQVDLPQEYLARPRWLPLSEADAALAKGRKVREHARRIGLPVAFVRMIGESAFSNRAIPFVRRIEGFERCRDEMIFEQTSPSCYSNKLFAAFREQSSTEVHATDDTPRRFDGGNPE